MTINVYPLSWPTHIPRSKSRETGRFSTTISKALDNVRGSIQRFANDSGKTVSGIVISSNYSLGVSRPLDPGVAVWFTWDGLQVCIPVDRYTSVESNLQAIHHIIEARRVELRHGTLALVRASFMGFKSLPPPEKNHWQILGLDKPGGTVNREKITEAYRALAAKNHPDAGGSDAAMAELNAARDAALREIAN